MASWMIPIPATEPQDLPAVGAAAHAVIDAQLADEDPDTIAKAHTHLNAALGVAMELINDGVFGDGLVSGTLSGSLPSSGSPYTTLSAQLSCAPLTY